MKKIALLVGHRKGSQGAFGNAGISEWNFNRELVKEVVKAAENLDAELKIFYRKDEGSGYTERIKEVHREIDAWGADITISFHFNAALNANANGHEVLHCASSQKSGEYAEIMNNIFNRNLNNRDRGVKPKTMEDRGGGFLCRGKSHCILIEPFFAYYQNEYMPGTEGRKSLINSIVEFIKTVS